MHGVCLGLASGCPNQPPGDARGCDRVNDGQWRWRGGGLTLYLGNKLPGKDKEANWIPAPAGEFSLWLRAYWPEQAMLDGTWKPPAINKIR